MKIQSLSVVVPNKKCVNDCKFCVSKMHSQDYENRLRIDHSDYALNQEDFEKRLAFARDNSCNNLMLTGVSEPQQNMDYIEMVAEANKKLRFPFRNIEMQTTGVLFDERMLRRLRRNVGVTTISLSISAFNDGINRAYIGASEKSYRKLKELCDMIKGRGFNLRLSINLTDWFDDKAPEFIFEYAEYLGANQVTFRVLYSSDTPCEQNDWIEEHGASNKTISAIEEYVLGHGRKLEKLEFGAIKYSIRGMGTVIDKDCMSQEEKDVLKYLILRENCRLYSKWDDDGSMIF